MDSIPARSSRVKGFVSFHHVVSARAIALFAAILWSSCIGLVGAQDFEIDKLPELPGPFNPTMSAYGSACDALSCGGTGNGFHRGMPASFVVLRWTLPDAPEIDPYIDAGFNDFGNNCTRNNSSCPSINALWPHLRLKYWRCPPGFSQSSASSTRCIRTGIDPGKNNECDETTGPCLAGNPANLLTGVKIESEIDYEGAGGSLLLERFYTSADTSSVAASGYGALWRHTYMRFVLSNLLDGAGTAKLHRPSGNYYFFRKGPTGAWLAEPDVPFRLEEILLDGTFHGWLTVGPDGTEERYDQGGRLTSIDFTDGRRLEIRYEGNRLAYVVDRKGRALVFAYELGRIAAVSLPDGHNLAYEYDNQGRLVEVAFESQNLQNTVRTYRYDDPVHPLALTAIHDESGDRYATWSYDLLGRVESSVHGAPAGNINRTTIAYGANGATVTKPLGERIDYSRLIQHGRAKVGSAERLCAGCGAGSRTYDANGYPDLVIDFAGTVTNFDYDARGLLTQRIDALGTPEQRTTRTDWHPVLRAPTERRLYDAANMLVVTTAWTYNARGQALTVTRQDPSTGDTRATSTRYCEKTDIDVGTCPLTGLVIAVDGPRTDVSDITTFAYYPADAANCASEPMSCPYRRGDLWKVTNSLGHVTETLAYDGAGRVLSTRDANGVVTDHEYHPRGWLTYRKVRGSDDAPESDDAITRIEYTPTGLVRQVTDPDGVVTGYEYDQAHRLIAIEDGEGNRIDYTLDNAGNRIKEDTFDTTGELLRTLSRVYDKLGQLQTLADADANPTDFTHDAEGNVETATDAYGRVTGHAYDPLGRLRRTLQDVAGMGAETSFEYDAQDRLIGVTDPKGLDTGYAYNAFGDLIQLSSPDTGITTYTYDSAGNRASATDARGETTAYSYDALNRLIGVTYSDASLNVTYSYDVDPIACGAEERFASGRLGRMTDGSGSTEYCHDRRGNLVRKVQVTNGLTFVTRYAYTTVGRLASVTYPSGVRVDYARNGLGQPTGVTVATAAGLRSLLTNVVWYPFGPAAELTYGDGRKLQRSLNRNYQPGFIEDIAPGGLSLGYEFDAVGNLQTLRKGDQSEPPLRTYGYDARDRLTGVMDGATGTELERYAYDATGNRIESTAGVITSSYAYPADSHRLAGVNAVPREYDAAGNTISIGTRTFVYTAANRMGQALRDGTVVGEYRYNGRGEQVWRQARVGVDCTGPDRESEACRGVGRDDNACESLRGRERGDCERGRHQPDNPGPPGGATVQTTNFAYGESGQLLGQYDETAIALHEIVWLDDLPIGLIAGSGAETKLFHIQADHLGTPRVIIDPARQQPIWTWQLSGDAFGTTPPNEDPDVDGTFFVFDLRFPGQRYDAASGLNYNYFRDYESGTGRYVESDPIGLKGDIATYSYAANKPLMFFDADGLEPLQPGSCSGAGVVTCDGNGGYEKRVCSKKCTASCTSAHENQHLADYRAMYPSKCRGKRRGENPWQLEDLGPNGAIPLDFYKFECRADRVGRKCAENLLNGRSNVCVSPDCEADIRNYIIAIDNRAARYRCRDYGW